MNRRQVLPTFSRHQRARVRPPRHSSNNSRSGQDRPKNSRGVTRHHMVLLSTPFRHLRHRSRRRPRGSPTRGQAVRSSNHQTIPTRRAPRRRASRSTHHRVRSRLPHRGPPRVRTCRHRRRGRCPSLPPPKHPQHVFTTLHRPFMSAISHGHTKGSSAGMFRMIRTRGPQHEQPIPRHLIPQAFSTTTRARYHRRHRRARPHRRIIPHMRPRRATRRHRVHGSRGSSITPLHQSKRSPSPPNNHRRNNSTNSTNRASRTILPIQGPTRTRRGHARATPTHRLRRQKTPSQRHSHRSKARINRHSNRGHRRHPPTHRSHRSRHRQFTPLFRPPTRNRQRDNARQRRRGQRSRVSPHGSQRQQIRTRQQQQRLHVGRPHEGFNIPRSLPQRRRSRSDRSPRRVSHVDSFFRLRIALFRMFLFLRMVNPSRVSHKVRISSILHRISTRLTINVKGRQHGVSRHAPQLNITRPRRPHVRHPRLQVIPLRSKVYRPPNVSQRRTLSVRPTTKGNFIRRIHRTNGIRRSHVSELPTHRIISTHRRRSFTKLTFRSIKRAISRTRDIITTSTTILSITTFRRRTPPPLFNGTITRRSSHPLLRSLFIINHATNVMMNIVRFLHQDTKHHRGNNRGRCSSTFRGRSFLVAPSVPILACSR